MKRRPSRSPVVAWSVGILLLLGLIALTHFTVGWESLLQPWREFPPFLLVAALGLVLGTYAIRTIRIHEYFQPATAGYFLRSYRLVLIHNLFNNLLPMRSGEASFPILMAREYDVPFSRSIPGLVYLRVLDLHFVVFMGGMVFAWEQGSPAIFLLLLLGPLPFALYRAQEWLLARLEVREGKLSGRMAEALRGFPTSPRLFWRTWMWTAVNWTLKLMVFAWVLRVFSPMPYTHALLGSTTGELFSVLPLHGVAGAGTYEAGVLASLIPLGVEMEAGLKAAVNLHLFLLGSSILAGALAALLRPRPRVAGDPATDAGP